MLSKLNVAINNEMDNSNQWHAVVSAPVAWDKITIMKNLTKNSVAIDGHEFYMRWSLYFGWNSIKIIAIKTSFFYILIKINTICFY